MACVDGFVLTHASKRWRRTDELVRRLLPLHLPDTTLDPATLVTFGACADPTP
jgi:pyruvate/2-oxoacid:ferredoxin oxidoreductase alpha subunit